MANKTLRLFIELDFSNHANFDDKGIQEIVEKVAESVKKTTDEIGITPDGYETNLEYIRVSEQFSNSHITLNV